MNIIQIENFIDKECMHMIKQLAWNTFKNTGDINTFMELMAVDNLVKELAANDNLKVNDYGDNKVQGFDNIRK